MLMLKTIFYVKCKFSFCVQLFVHTPGPAYEIEL